MILPLQILQILGALRGLMEQEGLQAYIVPAEDEHFTEFVADCHQRRAYISNFTGSAGTAIVTLENALLWTDGRYYFQAEQELDLTEWTVMKDGLPGTPSQSQWLTQNLNQFAQVGVDPALYTKGRWDAMESALRAADMSLVAVERNLVDEVWGTDRPSCSNNEIFSLGLEYAGKNSSEKVEAVRKAMMDNDASVMLVAELDEVAWLLNLRGKDIPSSSTFFSFVILTQTTLQFFVNPAQVPTAVTNILRQNIPEIQILNYETVYEVFPQTIAANPDGKVWVNGNANYKLVKEVIPDRLLVKLTPISLMKSIKNAVEVEGYRKALIRDAAALCEFFAWLTDAMDRGESVTEISASNKVYEIRQQRGGGTFFDKSFTTISATGLNAAVIHYMPTETTNKPLSKDELYLCDSGALYFDGTTDITRTLSFGTPTDFQRTAYTLVLKGQISLALAKFPNKTTGHRLDSFAREALWEAGLDYNHGQIHEGPQGIGSGFRADDPGLQVNMFTSNEPGYYDEERAFGIRLENVIRVKEADLPNNFNDLGFLEFEDLTFVPYDRKLIDVGLLSEEELDYLENYQQLTRDVVGKWLQDNDFPQAAYNWMWKETESFRNETSSDPPTTETNDGSSTTADPGDGPSTTTSDPGDGPSVTTESSPPDTTSMAGIIPQGTTMWLGFSMIMIFLIK